MASASATHGSPAWRFGLRLLFALFVIFLWGPLFLVILLAFQGPTGARSGIKHMYEHDKSATLTN